MTSITLTDLSALGTPEIVESVDFETIYAERKADLIALMTAAGIAFNSEMLEVSPVVALLEEATYKEIVLRARGNEIALNRYLYFARGVAVDHWAAFYDVVRLVGETDDRLKVRIILAIQARSPGGTPARYRLIALSTSLRVADAIVYVDDPDPTVHIALFAADNDGVADAALLALVTAAVTADDVRMVNDPISVESAVIQVVNIVAALTLLPDTPVSLLTTLAANLKTAWNSGAGLGRDLTRDWIIARLMDSSVHSVALAAPAASVAVIPRGAVQIGTVTLTVAGRAY
jgi:phage-related baseplate assembly protein